MASVSNFLTGPLERLDPSEGTTQVLVLTADAETAVALAEAVLRMTGPAGIELIPITSARRAKRIFADRPVLAAAGTPTDVRDLLKGSQLKLDGVRTIVLAWADEILSGGEDEVAALEAVMSEVPKDAARIVVTSRNEGRVNAFAERYLRRAHREAGPELDENAEPVAIQYVMASRSSRSNALRRLLDDMDPPSAAIVVSDDESAREVDGLLRTLGYHEGSAAVRVSRGEIQPSTYAVIFFDAPATRASLAAASTASPVSLVSLADAHELATLKRIAGGEVRPFTLSSAGNAARDREASMRRELEGVIDGGLASRELLSLEPLLERHDGIEIAAAALRLLEKERTLRKAQEESRPAQRSFGPPRDAGRGFSREGPREGPRGFSRGGEPRKGDREVRRDKDREGGRDARGFRDSRGDRGDRAPRRGPPRGNEGRPPRRDRP
jgi:ATP-dependent RNA helicase DeaD